MPLPLGRSGQEAGQEDQGQGWEGLECAAMLVRYFLSLSLEWRV